MDKQQAIELGQKLVAKRKLLKEHRSNPFITPQIHSQLQLRVEPLDVPSSNVPRYFQPYDSSKALRNCLEEDDEQLWPDDYSWIQDDLAHSESSTPWCHADMRALAFPTIVCHLSQMAGHYGWSAVAQPSKEHKLQSHNPYVYGGVEWSSTGIFLSSEDSHSLCVTANGAYPSDEYQLLTGEITAGLHLMIERLIYTFTEHTIFPVLVISLIGEKVRIIQIHYDIASGDVVVRPTKSQHFPTAGLEAIETVLRWMMCSAHGDTCPADKTKATDPKSVEVRSPQKAVKAAGA